MTGEKLGRPRIQPGAEMFSSPPAGRSSDHPPQIPEIFRRRFAIEICTFYVYINVYIYICGTCIHRMYIFLCVCTYINVCV